MSPSLGLVDGREKAVLDALVTRGPWNTTDGAVTGDEVKALYTAIRAGSTTPSLDAGLGTSSNRRADRAFQLLERSGLIVYAKRAWTPT